MKRTRWALTAALTAILGGSGVVAQDAPPDAGALFERLDKNSDGKLNRNEIPDDQARFFERLVRRGDKNQDGALTREEFEQANKPEDRPNVPLQGPNPEQARADARQRFDMIDRNKDGKVTLDELPDQFRERMKPMLDRLGKQELTFEEFSRLAGGARPGNPGEIFGRLDTNGDGKLTLEEAPERARPMVEAALRRAGKDKDGSLTRDEFAQNFPPPMPRDGGRPDGVRPDGDKSREGESRPDGDRPRDESRPEGDRPRDGGSPEGDRPRDGERRPDGDRPRGGRPMEGRGPAIFRLLDANHDGKLSKDELAKASEHFAELDRNQDGQLDPFELIGGPPGPPEGRPGQSRDGAAGTRDGNPRSAEPRREGDRPQFGRGAEGGAFFQRLDKNGDGKLSKDEVPDPMKERFSMLDTNGDGFVSQDELRAGAQQVGERIRNRNPEGRPDTPRRD